MSKHLAALLMVCCLSGCSKEVPSPDAPSPRIVSFSPALTRIIFEMGLGDHVVGVTTHCILPTSESRTIVGDRFSINAEAILAARPDLLLVQQNAKDFEAVRRISPRIKVEHFTIETLEDIAAAVERIGRLCEAKDAADRTNARFADELEAIRRRVANLDQPRVLFISGTERPLTAGANTFIDQMINIAGGINAGGSHTGWRMNNVEGILTAAPDVLICQASPGGEVAAREYLLSLPDLPAACQKRIFVVTEVDWTIPSTRLANLAAEMAELIHPELSAAGEEK